MLESVRNHQDILYFLDYLHRMPRTNEFPFVEALETLQRLIPDSSSEKYMILCKCIHFLNCKFKLSIEAQDEAALLREILSLDCEKPILEFKRGFSNPDLIELNKWVKQRKLTVFEAAKILIKFACTRDNPQNTGKCPYLDFQGHLKALQKIEEVLGFVLPSDIIANFLFFQTASREIFDVIDAFIRIRSTIKMKWLETVAIPRDLYDDWMAQGNNLIQSLPQSNSSITSKYCSEGYFI